MSWPGREWIVSLTALSIAGCTLVFDTGELADGPLGGTGGAPPAGGAGGSATTTGGAGGECRCDDEDVVWLFTAPEAALTDTPPECSESEPVQGLHGFLDGSLVDDDSHCTGDCTPLCSVRLQLADDCTVSGSTVTAACTTLTLTDEGPSFKVALPPPTCSPIRVTLAGAPDAPRTRPTNGLHDRTARMRSAPDPGSTTR